MSPLEFLERYRRLRVEAVLEDASARQCRRVVQILSLRTYFMMSWKAGSEQMGDYQVTTAGSTQSTWFRTHREAIRNAGMGKGAPRDYELALEWAVRSGKVTSPSREALQRYADEHLGVDCSGFVTNYLVAEGKKARGAGTIRNTSAASYFDRGRAVNDPTDVRQGDVLVWMRGNAVLRGPGHVALVQSYVPASIAGGNLRVVEATGSARARPKLSDSRYEVQRIEEPGPRRSTMILECRRFGVPGTRVAVMRY